MQKGILIGYPHSHLFLNVTPAPNPLILTKFLPYPWPFDHYSMHKLIYKDIRDAQIQKEILQYIYQQAKVQAAHNQIGHLSYSINLL